MDKFASSLNNTYWICWQGVLPDGREIAVKRLFTNREQSVSEFFNEVNLISRVQHKNLVKLLGCSVDGPDKLLVYEYLPNKSLDHFLFGNFLNLYKLIFITINLKCQELLFF
jgi:serine/threonine protein kinase